MSYGSAYVKSPPSNPPLNHHISNTFLITLPLGRNQESTVAQTQKALPTAQVIIALNHWKKKPSLCLSSPSLRVASMTFNMAGRREFSHTEKTFCNSSDVDFSGRDASKGDISTESRTAAVKPNPVRGGMARRIVLKWIEHLYNGELLAYRELHHR